MITIQMIDKSETNNGFQVAFDLNDSTLGCNASLRGDIRLSPEQTLEPRQDQIAYRWLADSLEEFATHVRANLLD